MKLLQRNFRLWWQRPRNIADRPEHRQVTFLELFYDLVYVVLIAELTHTLSEHIELKQVGNFIFLFIMVWWAWLNGTLYHELHGNDDIRTRVFTFLQMFTIVSMAVFAHNALSNGADGFALSYAAFLLILTYMWWRTGVHDPNHRPLSNPYSFSYLMTALLIGGSVFIPTPERFYIWGFAIAISLLMPIVILGINKNDQEVQAQSNLSRTPTHSLVERFGLFAIIVLGEVIVGVVQGLADQDELSEEIGVIAVLGMTIAIGIWWLYFDFVSHRLPKPQNPFLLWMYTHIPLTIGIATTGAAVLNVIEHSEEHLPDEVRWLLVGAIAATLLSIAILIQMLSKDEIHQEIHYRGRNAMLISAGLILLLGVSGLETIPLLIIITLLMLAPVFIGFIAWVREMELQATGNDTI